MRVTILAIVCIMYLCAGHAHAQTDSTTYMFGLPIEEDDTVQNFPQEDLAPANQYQKMNADQLPAKLRKSLRSNSEFEGWEKSGVYYDKNTELYYIRIRREDEIRIIGLNKNGKSVTFNAASDIDDL